MTSLVKAALFLTFLVLGIRVARATTGRPLAIRIFVAFTLLVNIVAGLSSKDSWPFSTYAVYARGYDVDSVKAAIVVKSVGQNGSESWLDAAVWSPMSPAYGLSVFSRMAQQLSPEERDEVGRFLLTKAREVALERTSGEWVGHRRLLGPLSAPVFTWTLGNETTDIPSAIRVYEASYSPRRYIADPTSARWRLLWEYPER